MLRWSEWHQPWATVEVMMLGILVALIKISDLATVVPGIGLFAARTLVVLITAMTVNFDPQEVWNRIEWANSARGREFQSRPLVGEKATGRFGTLTGMRLGLVTCESCGLLSRPVDIEEPGKCPRCGAELEVYRHNAIQRTGALLIAR